MSLSLRAQLAERDLDVAIDLASGRTLALIGTNGSGKSSTLSILAGLLRPDTGRAELDGDVLFDLGRGSWVAPHARRVGVLAQRPLLFPKMTVLDNVAFGPRSRGESRSASRELARQWLATVDAEAWASRRPRELSGGQQQRVALARALATEPQLLLLDEPLSATDADLAPAMRQTLRRVLRGRTAIIVTHQVLDAVLLCDEVAVLEAGRVVEHGSTDAVLRRPRSRFAASISGLNMMRGVGIGDHALRTDAGDVVHGEVEVPLHPGEPAIAIFRPEAVSVHLVEPGGSPRNHFTGTLTAIEPQAHLIRLRMGELSADITPHSAAQLGLRPGVPAVFAVKAAEVQLYSAS